MPKYSQQDADRLPWRCTYCGVRYAEYINGCPRCYLPDLPPGQGSSSVVLAPKLTDQERAEASAYTAPLDPSPIVTKRPVKKNNQSRRERK